MILLTISISEIILFAGLEFHTVKGDCGAIPVFEKTSSNLTGDPPYPEGTSAEITCNPGYARSGYPVIKCQADGTWWQYAVPPRCQVKSCGDPGTPQNGRKDTYLYEVGNTVYYSCDEGYDLQGDSNRLCLVTSEWTGSVPTCIVLSCPSLHTPVNGALQGSALTYQSTISLVCNEGFTSVGPTSRVCQGDKTWSNQEFVCQEIDCGPYGTVPNAVVEPQGGTTWGESVYITCFPNATSTSAQSSTVIHCNDQGVWAPEPQQCYGCCDVSEIQGDNSAAYISNRNCIAHGDLERSSLFSCNRGYSLSNSGITRTCTNGSMVPLITCQRIKCTIQPVSNGHILEADVGNIVDFDSMMTVECSQGYNISGTNPTQCSKSTLYPSCYPAGCAIPTDFMGNISDAETKRTVKPPLISTNTKIIYTCPENFVVPPSMKSSMHGTCVNGVLSPAPSCIEAPCPVTSVPDFDPNKLAAGCLLIGGMYIRNGCFFSVECSDGTKLNGTCVFGQIIISCEALQQGLPVWGMVVIGVVVLVTIIGLAIIIFKKVLHNKQDHKRVLERDPLELNLKDYSANKEGKGEPV